MKNPKAIDPRRQKRLLRTAEMAEEQLAKLRPGTAEYKIIKKGRDDALDALHELRVNPGVMKNPTMDDYRQVLAVMPVGTPLKAAQIAKRVAMPTKQVVSMLNELRRYGLVKTGIDGYTKVRSLNPGAKWHLMRALDIRKQRHKTGTTALRDRYAGMEEEHKHSAIASSKLGMTNPPKKWHKDMLSSLRKQTYGFSPEEAQFISGKESAEESALDYYKTNPAKVKCDKCGEIVNVGDFAAQIDHMYNKHGAKSDSDAGRMARKCFELVTKNPRKLSKRSSKQSWTPVIVLAGVGALIYFAWRNKEV